jgi:hypothetical protein
VAVGAFVASVVGEGGAAAVAVVVVAAAAGVAVGVGVGSVIVVAGVGGVDVRVDVAVAERVGADVVRGVVGGSIVDAGLVGGIVAVVAAGIVVAAFVEVAAVGVAVGFVEVAAGESYVVVGRNAVRASGRPDHPRGRVVPSGRADSLGVGVELCHQLGSGICYKTRNNCPHT